MSQLEDGFIFSPEEEKGIVKDKLIIKSEAAAYSFLCFSKVY